MVSGQKQAFVLLKALEDAGGGVGFAQLVQGMKRVQSVHIAGAGNFVNGPVPLTRLVDELQTLGVIRFSAGGFAITPQGRDELRVLKEYAA